MQSLSKVLQIDGNVYIFNGINMTNKYIRENLKNEYSIDNMSQKNPELMFQPLS